MSVVDYGCTIAKRRLSRRLLELRVEAGYTANQVCDRLNWGRGKVGRFEGNVWTRPSLSDIRDLGRIYGVDEALMGELEQLALTARHRAWWREYIDVFGENEYPGYEADAVRISVYLTLMLPGLLQTDRYMHALMDDSSQPPEWRGRAVEARLRRQQILERTDGRAPSLTAIITEASLLFRWGTLEERRAQVLHLAEMSQRANVEIRLLAFANGPHPGMTGPINIFEFADEDPMVYIETEFKLEPVGDRRDVESNLDTFGRILKKAVGPEQTTEHLMHLAETLE